ncbi:MAG: FAD-dependent oxidoreductase [Desulfuromonas sp.]|nr:MAG: FAD-dependent oxidoreductase [Desulfuromonas sp.]
MEHSDFLVVGGGVIGSAVACGLLHKKCSVTLLDAGGDAFNASLANFGLVWVQGKGQGSRRYAEWCHEASELFPEYVRQLETETGIDLAYRKPGGLVLCHGEEEYQKREKVLERLRNESRHGSYDCHMLDRADVQKMLPNLTLGPGITGGSYSAHDGYLNPLALLKALHMSFTQGGGHFCSGTAVTNIGYQHGRFLVTTNSGEFTAEKIVLAAGNAMTRLSRMVGMDVQVHPEQGQLMVTERTRPTLSMPISGIQQTAEGSFIVGLSNRNVGFNTDTDTRLMKQMAQRVVNAFPALACLKIVRSWSSLRVLTADGLPIYQQSERCPGAYAVTAHSGVTLAPQHQIHIADWIAEGVQPEEFERFSTRRFDVEKTA